eukprot:Hpha_TRINITY_DN11424_c0_g1::TRINITY_DN11424_c0_g1_i1::g.137440::m.137440
MPVCGITPWAQGVRASKGPGGVSLSRSSIGGTPRAAGRGAAGADPTGSRSWRFHHPCPMSLRTALEGVPVAAAAGLPRPAAAHAAGAAAAAHCGTPTEPPRPSGASSPASDPLVTPALRWSGRAADRGVVGERRCGCPGCVAENGSRWCH